MTLPIKITRGYQKFIGLERCAVYLTKGKRKSLEHKARLNGKDLHEEIAALVEDGLKWRAFVESKK